jgi:hypothetical protein
MPYFLCPACALRAYSAAAGARCPRCDTWLDSDDQLHPSLPPAQPVSGRWSREARLRASAAATSGSRARRT